MVANRGGVVANPAGAGPTNTSSPQNASASSDLYVEAVELATNFILKSQLQNPKVLSRAEMPVELASYGAVWKSDDAIGAVKIVPPEADVKGVDVAAAVAADDSKNCQGKFASGRVSELIDNDVVFRGFSSCEDSAGSRTAQYFIIPRKQGGFVVFSVASSITSAPAQSPVADEKLPGYERAALTAAR